MLDEERSYKNTLKPQMFSSHLGMGGKGNTFIYKRGPRGHFDVIDLQHKVQNSSDWSNLWGHLLRAMLGDLFTLKDLKSVTWGYGSYRRDVSELPKGHVAYIFYLLRALWTIYHSPAYCLTGSVLIGGFRFCSRICFNSDI